MARSYTNLTRAEQRKHRLLEMENEQRLEDFEALKMTDEQRRTLLRPFASVKFEFSDLDGLRWTSSALRQVHQPQCADAPQKRLHRATTSTAFVVLTNADLASFSGEDTIRVSVTSMDHRNGKRSRSPLKGLFPVHTSEKNTPASSFAGFPAWYTAGKKPYNEGHDNEEGVHPDDDEDIDDELDLDDSNKGDLTFVAESVDLDLEFDEDHSDRVQQYLHSFVGFHTPFPPTSLSDIDVAGQQHTFTDLYPKRPPSRMDLYYDQ